MLRKGMTKLEIEKELIGRGDYVQIDYLNRFLKEDPAIEIKKFVYTKLAEIYERINMLRDAGKCYESAASFSITFKEKIEYFVKATELYIRAADFEEADKTMKKALADANSMQRNEIYRDIKNFYRRQAEFFEKNLRKVHAVKAYEKLLAMNISESEKNEIKNKLLDLYEKLGRRKEFFC